VHYLAEKSVSQMNADGLDLGVVVEGIRAKLTTKAGFLVASEGSLVVDDIVVVDPDGTARKMISHEFTTQSCQYKQ
jgi:hypothetical protein